MADLSKWDKTYAETEVDNFDELPPGRYQCVVTGLKLSQTQNTHEDMLAWELTVAAGEYKNRKLWLNQVVREKSFKSIRKNLECFGFTDKFSALEKDEVRQTFLGRGIEITRTLGKNKNEETGEYPIWTNFQKEIEISGPQVNIAPPMGSVPF
jgi:hypothetical protein